MVLIDNLEYSYKSTVYHLFIVYMSNNPINSGQEIVLIISAISFINVNIKSARCSCQYRSGTVNSNTINSKFHLIRSYCEIFFYHFLNISCLKCTVNSNFHLIRSKTLPTNDFELTVPDL